VLELFGACFQGLHHGCLRLGEILLTLLVSVFRHVQLVLELLVLHFGFFQFVESNQNLQMRGLLILARRTLAGLLFQGFEPVQACLLLFTQRLELLDRSLLSNFSLYAATVVAAVFDLFQVGQNTSVEQQVHVQ
jgi:hypothetical protein